MGKIQLKAPNFENTFIAIFKFYFLNVVILPIIVGTFALSLEMVLYSLYMGISLIIPYFFIYFGYFHPWMNNKRIVYFVYLVNMILIPLYPALYFAEKWALHNTLTITKGILYKPTPELIKRNRIAKNEVYSSKQRQQYQDRKSNSRIYPTDIPSSQAKKSISSNQGNQIMCPSCSASLTSKSKFCTSCGASL